MVCAKMARRVDTVFAIENKSNLLFENLDRLMGQGEFENKRSCRAGR